MVDASPPTTSSVPFGPGALLCAWLLACDVGLKGVARLGGCDPALVLEPDLLGRLWSDPSACPGTDLAGPWIRLRPDVRHGDALGLLTGEFHGVLGQIWGLALVALATVVTVLVLRWRFRADGDGALLGCVWAGVLAHALPRLLGAGHGFTEIELVGFATGVGDLALGWGLGWLVLRVVAELRA